ncbi:MAG: hypothetical protein MJB14_08780 [Spirochaetes bacterium]|nr:hypothetical protein [Spirochaetota bacterium]
MIKFKDKKVKYLTVFWITILVMFNLLAVLRAHPVNFKIRTENNPHTKMNNIYYKHDYRTTLRFYKVWREAVKQASKPFLEVKDHFLYRKKNPGLFVFIAEMFIRMGAKSPFPVQLFAIFLFNIGLIAGFIWQKEYFQSMIIPIASTVFLVITPYSIYHSSSIHQYPYSFIFFNLTMLCFVYYLKTERKYYFLLTCLFYFLLCQFYYMYYISTFVLLVGFYYLEKKKWFTKETILMTLVPIISFIIIIIEVSILYGGLTSGFHRLVDFFLARSVDIRIPNSNFPNEIVMSFKNLLLYPLRLSKKVHAYYYLSITSFICLFAVSLILAAKEKRLDHYKPFLIIIPAGLSWHLFMIEHTMIHPFSVLFSYFLWMLIFSFFVRESFYYIKNGIKTDIGPRILVAFSPLIIIPMLMGFLVHYCWNVIFYLKNLIF